MTLDHRTDRRAPSANLVSGTVRVGDLPGKVWRVRLVPYPPRLQLDVDTMGAP